MQAMNLGECFCAKRDCGEFLLKGTFSIWQRSQFFFYLLLMDVFHI